MKLKEGMYVRTEDGEILKIKHTEDVYTSDDEYVATMIYFGDCFHINSDEIVKKPSYNIIDLIEVGDYVNGRKVLSIHCDDGFDLYLVLDGGGSYDGMPLNQDIKSIVTKEQFEAMKYEIK